MPLRPETRARARALQLLYAWETDGHPPPESMLQRLQRLAGNDPVVRRLTEELFTGVAGEWQRLDATIAEAAEHWRLGRLARIDRNILRLAVHELLHQRVPPRVAIDEALWLAHRFGGVQSPAFVNGVLDRIARSLGQL